MSDPSANPSEIKLDRAVIDVVIRLAFLGALAYWAMLIIGPFIIIVIWAGILAAALSPVYVWVKGKVGRSGLAATIITLSLLAIILGPAGVLSTSLIESARDFTEALKDGTLDIPPPKESVKDWPVIGSKAFNAWSQASTNLTVFLKQHSETLTQFGSSFLSAAAGVGGGILSFAVSIIIAGFIYSRSGQMADSLGRFADRLIEGRGREFVAMSGATVRNVARGVLGVVLIQSILIGIGLTLAGIPAAGVLTLLVFLLGIIQMPPWLITVPAIIWAWGNTEFVTALIFTVYMAPVTMLDNVLKPILMAKGLKTPMLVIFIGVIGGTFAHGLIGLFLGPIILAVFWDVMTAWIAGDLPDADGEDDEDSNAETEPA